MLPIENNIPNGIRIVSDDDECERLWKALYPVESIFDLWDVRQIFSRQYQHKNYFIVHETEKKQKKNESKPFYDNKMRSCSLPILKEEKEIDGFLPLSWIEESGSFAFFPGETWNGRTWMEQNRIIANSREIIAKLLESIPGPAEIRYLRREHVAPLLLDEVENAGAKRWDCSVDETGYLFFSGNSTPVHGTSGHCYASLSHYFSSFSGKSRKKIISEIQAIEKQGVTFRYNCLEDMDILFQLNLKNFGERSFFYDVKFLNAFKALSRMFHQNKKLRIVTVLVDQRIAAVDMGVIWNNCCTLLAGGTSRDFPGIAKLINLHHIQWACSHNNSHKEGFYNNKPVRQPDTTMSEKTQTNLQTAAHHRFQTELSNTLSEGVKSLDFLCGDFGWKERFHLSARPLYRITIPKLQQQEEKCYDHASFA